MTAVILEIGRRIGLRGAVLLIWRLLNVRLLEIDRKHIRPGRFAFLPGREEFQDSSETDEALVQLRWRCSNSIFRKALNCGQFRIPQTFMLSVLIFDAALRFQRGLLGPPPSSTSFRRRLKGQRKAESTAGSAFPITEQFGPTSSGSNCVAK